MNQNADALFKLLIPGIFLLLWALGQLFNKEAVQARAARQPQDDPLGPRPNRQDRPARSDFDEDPFGANAGATPAPANSPARLGGREIIYDPRTGRPIGLVLPSGNPDRGSTSRSKSRRGGSSTRTSKPNEPAIETPRARLATPLDQEQTLTEAAFNAATVDSNDRVTLSAESVRSWLTSPVRVREAILMNQILGPPPGLARLNRARRLH